MVCSCRICRKKCDGCGCRFSIERTLKCKEGGLVVDCHNEVKDEYGALVLQAMNTNHVRDKPKIIIGHSESKSAPASANTHGTTPPPNPTTSTHQDGIFFDRENLLVRGLWDKNTGCVLDIRVTDTYQPAHRGSTPEKVVAAQERTKKNMYQARCFENRRNFVPYVCRMSGFPKKEAKAYNKRIVALLVKKR